MTREEFLKEVTTTIETGKYLTDLHNQGLPIPIDAIEVSAALRIAELITILFGIQQKIEFKDIGGK